MNIPLFAADIIGVIFGVIFVIISIVSALSNMAKEKNKPQPGKQKQKAALQVELEKFLQEAMNPKPENQQQQQPANADFLEEDAFDVEAPVKQSPQRRRRRQRKSQPARTQQQKKNAQASTKSQSTGQQMVQRQKRAEIEEQERQKRLGGAIRERIEQKNQSHVSSSIQGHLSTNVNPQVSGGFDSLDAELKNQSTKSAKAKKMRGLIKDPQSLRQAIILNEILSPPKSLRRS